MRRIRECRAACRRRAKAPGLPIRPVDRFAGGGDARRLSFRLMRGEGPEVPDDDIAAVLGPGVVDAFRFAEERLRGKRRRTTDEPVFCHSADIALRARDMGYGHRVLVASLLHDVVEEASGDLGSLDALLDVVSTRFGPDTGRDVRILTNRYATLLDGVRREVPASLPFIDASRGDVSAALERHRDALDPALAAAYSYEFHQLLEWFVPHAEVSRGHARARVDRGHTVFAELQLQSYRLFATEMADDARTRGGPTSERFCEVPLVIKCLDLVDNLRTAEVVSWRALDRILLKTEMFLDGTFYLHDHLHRLDERGVTFIPMYDYLKHQLVEQLEERARALAFLADTRFAPLAEFLEGQLRRLHQKYKVGHNPLENISRLRQRIQSLNDARSSRLVPARMPGGLVRP